MRIRHCNRSLKQSADLTPASSVTGGGTELSMPVADKTTFDELYQSWCAQDLNPPPPQQLLRTQERLETYGFRF